MAISDAVQTLTAAFSFGIVLEALCAGLFICFRRHDSKILQDGQRLVLVLFLLFTSLWVQIEFANLMIPTGSSRTCRGTLIASTIFDQLSRVALVQFIFWSIGRCGMLAIEKYLMPVVMVVRLGLGLGMTFTIREDFAPTCVAQTSILAPSIAVIALDAGIICWFIARTISMGMFRDLQGKVSTSREEQSRAVILFVAGFTVWTGTSVAMILGVPGILLIFRTTLPSIGLLVLVAILIAFHNSISSAREENMTTPEAQSPFITSTTPSREITRDNHASGTPKSSRMYAKNGPLFVVNQTPRDSLSNFQTNRDSDTRGFKQLEDMPPIEITGSLEQGQTPSRPMPSRRGSSGVFGSIVGAPLINGSQGQLAPTNRPGTTNRTREAVPAVAASRTPQKKNLFGWSSSPSKPHVRSLGISMPIMAETEETDDRPFAKIPTVDLATAAINEKERRRATIERSRPFEIKPMPPPPSYTPEEGLRNSISTKRKIPSTALKAPLPPVPASVLSNMLTTRTDATSSSTSLSPGHEELRRRSPRNLNSFDGLVERIPEQRPNIQRNPTIGLPSNPRSQRSPAKDQGVISEQSVTHVKDIAYDNPGMLNTIIRDAVGSEKAPQRPQTADTSSPASYTINFQTSDPIIHRPRPYRKDSETDRALFPSASSPYHNRSKSSSKFMDINSPLSPHHKRSKSSSAISTRKSIFDAPVGSPTNLPPLPMMPTSAKELKRLLPNNTKSMTFSEKIELLFPAPPQSTLSYKRRSSVPSLPRVPSIFMSDFSTAQSTTEGDNRSRRTSKRSTIASLAMAIGVSHQNSSPKSMAARSDDRHILHFSPTGSIFDAITWLPQRSQADDGSQNAPVKGVEPESVDDLQFQRRESATASDESDQDDATTYWGSVHSKAPLVDVKAARQNARSTYIQRAEQELQIEPPVPQISTMNDNQHPENSITILLDKNSEESKSTCSPLAEVNRRSFLPNVDETLPIDKTFIPLAVPAWHHRIGDQLPTFSERDTNIRLRKMPPPTPLLLSKIGRNATLIVRAAEPSPIESPEQTIEEIKAQLQRFEEPSRDSYGSLLRDADRRQTQIEDRLRLLDNLEKEMGQQEDQWQQMQTNLDRNSTSTVSTLRSPPPPPPKDTAYNRLSSQNGSKRRSRIATRQARFRNSVAQMYRGEDSTCTTSSQSSDNSRASVWQQRLAEAQVEYLENAPALLGKSLNFLATSNMQLGSPTPPESLDSETDVDTELEPDSDNDLVETLEFPTLRKSNNISLWEPSPPSPQAAAGRLWNHPYEASNPETECFKPAAITLRPTQRKVVQPLNITSFSLWSKPSSPASRRSAFGLWCCQKIRPKSIATKRASQKPKRQTRRLTYLPDIVESPLPLPNRTDTLGVFQFAWGEVSDQPVYQPNFLPGFIPSVPVNSQFALRSQQLEPEGYGYSSSFFDDYDDEESGDEEANYDSEDEFDDSTLTEIADLLRSRDVPSRASMFSPQRLESYYDGDSTIEVDFDANEIMESVVESPVQLPILPLAIQQKAQPAAGIFLSQNFRPGQEAEESPLKGSFIQTLLWTKPLERTVSRKNGLFSVNDDQPLVRETANFSTPATRGMTRRLSLNQVPLGHLTTTELWSGSRSQSIEHDWISESSVRPFSPSICSSPASDVSSADISDSSSVNTVSTKSSSFWGSIGSSARANVPGWWESRSMKTIAQPGPIDNEVPKSLQNTPVEASQSGSKIPWLNRQKSQGTLRTVRESRDFWETNTKIANRAPALNYRKSSVSKIPALPSKKSCREFQSIVASEADWDTALADAIIAGQPPKRLTRHAATKEEWESALSSAVKQSKRRPARYGATREEWDAALSLAVCQSNKKPQRVHASSDMWNSALEHSASKSQTLPKTQLWGASVKPVSPSQGLLWLRGNAPKQKVISQTFSMSPTKTKKSVPAETLEFSVLESNNLWQPTQVSFTEHDWLSQKTTAAKTWVTGEYSTRSQSIEKAKMWSKPTNAISDISGDLFSHVKADGIQKPKDSLPAALSHLNSTQLFTATVSATNETINWLHSMPSRTVLAPSSSLWSPCAKASPTKSADMFSHSNKDVVKIAKRSLPSDLPQLNSNQLFQPISNSGENDIHWLIETSPGFVSSPLEENTSKSIPSSSTWERSPNPTPSKCQPGLWTSQALVSVPNQQKALFYAVEIKEPWVRKQRTLEGSAEDIEITSRGLWNKRKSEGPVSPKNWLVKAKMSRVQFRY